MLIAINAFCSGRLKNRNLSLPSKNARLPLTLKGFLPQSFLCLLFYVPCLSFKFPTRMIILPFPSISSKFLSLNFSSDEGLLTEIKTGRFKIFSTILRNLEDFTPYKIRFFPQRFRSNLLSTSSRLVLLFMFSFTVVAFICCKGKRFTVGLEF